VRREIGDRAGAAESLNSLADVAAGEGVFPAARALYEECLSLQREIGERAGITYSLYN
jgi:hypothetical protein